METRLQKRAKLSGAKAHQSQYCETLRITTNQKNPLLVDLILEKIFEYIIAPISSQESTQMEKARISTDVKNFRLVCKLWQTTCTAIFRKLRPLFKLCEGGLKDFVNVMTKREKSKITPVNPVQRYILDVNFQTENTRQLLEDFYEVCRPEMVELGLRIDGFEDPFQSDFNSSGIAFPKLKKLDVFIKAIIDREISKEKELRYGADIVAFLLRSGKNLQHFKLDFEYMSDEQDYLDMMRLIPGNLQTVEIKLKNISSASLEIFAERNAKWKTFRIIHPTEGVTCTTDAVRKFFTGIAETLGTLRWPASESTLFSEGFPALPKVTDLSLDCRPWWKCMPISFPSIFPNLVEISFENFANPEELLILLSSSARAPSVEKITFPRYEQTAELVKRVAILFPNAKRLYVSASGSHKQFQYLQAVFASFPDVEELKIVFLNLFGYPQDGDALLSGLSSSECQNIREKSNFENINLNEFQRKPSILQLTGLKVLELELLDRIWFSDFSAHLIFLKMDNLKVLRSDCGFRQMSAGALQLLMNKLDEIEVRDFFGRRAFFIVKEKNMFKSSSKLILSVQQGSRK